MPARLKDIANDLNLSVVTISKVLRDHPDISSETRERVLQRMKELNYRPNLAARALVTGRSFIAGLVVPDLVHPFFGQVAKGISSGLRKKGYSLWRGAWMCSLWLPRRQRSKHSNVWKSRRSRIF